MPAHGTPIKVEPGAAPVPFPAAPGKTYTVQHRGSKVIYLLDSQQAAPPDMDALLDNPGLSRGFAYSHGDAAIIEAEHGVTTWVYKLPDDGPASYLEWNEQ